MAITFTSSGRKDSVKFIGTRRTKITLLRRLIAAFMILQTMVRVSRPPAQKVQQQSGAWAIFAPTLLDTLLVGRADAFSAYPNAFVSIRRHGRYQHWAKRGEGGSSGKLPPLQRCYFTTSKFLNDGQVGSSRSKTFSPGSFVSSLFSSPPDKTEVDPGVVEGTDLRIVKYPHPALRSPNDEVTLEELQDSTEMADLAKGMLKVMYAAEGVGLAAPQVGVNKRLMVYNPTGDSKKWLEETILVNPEIVNYSEAKDEEIEGCLSFPDMSGEVVRSKWIKVEALNLKGKKIKKKFTGWEARIFQHEYDHLDGTVYIDRLSEETRAKVQPRLNELIADFGDGGSV